MNGYWCVPFAVVYHLLLAVVKPSGHERFLVLGRRNSVGCDYSPKIASSEEE